MERSKPPDFFQTDFGWIRCWGPIPKFLHDRIHRMAELAWKEGWTVQGMTLDALRALAVDILGYREVDLGAQ